MERGYSGLRRTRKRAHSSKCPCCYSSEEEQENHASAKKEKLKDGNQNTGKRLSTRKRKLASDDDVSTGKDVTEEVFSPAESLDENQNSKKLKTPSQKSKKNGTKRTNTPSKQKSSSNAFSVEKLEQNKQNGKPAKVAAKKKSRTGQSTSSSKNEGVDGSNLTKSKDSLEKMASTQIQLKSKKAKKKNTKQERNSDAGDSDKNEIELKEGVLNIKKNNGKTKNLASTRNNRAQKQSNQDVGLVEEGRLVSGVQRPRAKVNKPKSEKQNKSQGKKSESGDVHSQSLYELSKEKENNKHSKTNVSNGSLAKRKVEVFDHLFCELKKCPGFSKITVSSAAELLLKLTADKLKSVVHGPPSRKPQKVRAQDKLPGGNLPLPSTKSKTTSTSSEPKRQRSESEKSPSLSSEMNNASCLSPPRKKTSGKAEETKLSQAAEALVSFRANPTILRQDKTEAVIPLVQSPNKGITNNNVEKISDTSQGSGCKEACTIVDASVTASNEVRVSQAFDSCYVNAPSQLQSGLLVQGALHQPIQLPASIGASLQQVATVQKNLMNLSQLTSQLNSASTVPTPVSPRLSAPSSENLSTSVMSTRMVNPVGVQNIQALFCRPTQPLNIQTSLAVQTPVPSLPVSGNNQQLRPQQPLKGMEDVVSCVGSRSATNLLWNMKPATPPVVYLTSPQTLSGVRARNFIPQNEGHRPLPFTPGAAKVQSVGIPKSSLSSASTSVLTLGKVTLVSQASPLSTSHASNVAGQRPILPREQRIPAFFPNLPQSASQLPVTTVVGPIPRSVPPVHVGSIPVQLSVPTSPLNTRQPPFSTAVTHGPVTQDPVMQAPVMQAACVTTGGQLTAVSATVSTPVSAKQAVKRFVHERTKSAELKRTSSLSNLLLNEPVTSTAIAESSESSAVSVPSSESGQSIDQAERQSISKHSEFNLQQAASALLSISSQDGLDAAEAMQPGGGDGDDSLDEHDDEVVFTSKGVFRVGDVDVDPKYNRIGREGYTCGKCGKIFTSLSYLARHIKRVCPDMSCRKWKCTMCDKAFRHPFGLQQHIYTHTGERPHKCSQCPKAFYSSNDLRRHSRIHSGERPYHCKHCDKSFATTISLKTHTYIHTGEKPHKCPHCPKTFATSSKLGRHIVTHSEQRPFACDHCPKSFNRSGDLRRHNMHVHESRDKPFDLEDCGTPFNTTSNVSIPRDTPTDQGSATGQLHQCSVCGEMHDSSSDLGRHMLCHATLASSAFDGAAMESIAPKTPNQELDHLDESTESGSVDSN